MACRPTEIADDLRQRNEQQGLRHQVGDEDHRAEAAGPREVEPGQGVARSTPQNSEITVRDQGDEHRDQHPTREVVSSNRY